MSRAVRRLAAALLLLLGAAPGLADDLRPVQVQILEREPGTYLVRWRVPRIASVSRSRVLPVPVLPAGFRAVGERAVEEGPGGWLARQTFRSTEGLPGQALGVDYGPLAAPWGAVFRVELSSGERHAGALGPGEAEWLVPRPEPEPWAAALRDARASTLRGARHAATLPVHLALALVLALAGSASAALRAAGAFTCGQVLSLAVPLALGRTFDGGAADACVALAVVMLGRSVLSEGRAPMARIALAAGALHGLALAGEGASWAGALCRAFGMDAALLSLALVAFGLLRAVPDALRDRARLAAGTLAGGLAVAVGLSAAFGGPLHGQPQLRESPAAGALRTSLAELLDGPGGLDPRSGAGPSRPGPQMQSDAPIRSFLSVEPFEVRHEVLVRVRDHARDLGVEAGGAVEVDAQEAVVQRAVQLVSRRCSLELDGAVHEGLVDRAGFVTVDATGVLPRETPQRERVDTALVGVTLVHLTPGVPRELTLTWSGITGAPPGLPVTIVDPETTRTTVLDEDAPVLRWRNELERDPVPRPEPVAVEPSRFALPTLSLALLVFAAWAGLASPRRARRRALGTATARLAVVAALLLGPSAHVGLPVPSSWVGVSEAGARRILSGVLPGVYRALELREETAAYDRLALAVSGDALTDVYVEHRRALELEERGGARARVEAVEVTEADDLRPLADGGFAMRATWTVAGSVTHFGHRHFRQNRYSADVTLFPIDGLWRLSSIQVVGEERLR